MLNIRSCTVLVFIATVLAACATPPAQDPRVEQARIAQEQERARLERLRREEESRRLAEEAKRPKVSPELADAMKLGRYRCELRRHVDLVELLPNGEGVVLRWKQQQYEMRAVQANSGALRLEDNQSGLVWISIVGKSMLFDSRKGRQLANECRL